MTRAQILFFISLLSFGLNAGTASAQSSPSAESDALTKWGLIAGAGAYVTPNYSGDDNYRVLALPFIRGSYGDNFRISVPEGANYDVYKNGPLTLTAKAGIAFPRDEDGRSFLRVAGEPTQELLGFGDLGASIELGANAEYDFGPLTVSAGLRRGVGGHGSLVGDASVNYTKVFKTPGPPIALILSPNIKFGEASLTQTYYGITNTQASAAGLSPFTTDGGIYSVGLNALSFVPTSRKSAFILFGTVRELVGDAADSPLISERGSTTQASFGLFWVTAFGQDARNAEKLIGK